MNMSLTQIKALINNQQETLIYIILSIITYYLSVYLSKDWSYYQHSFDKNTEAVDWKVFLSQITIFKEPLYLVSTKFFGELIGYSEFILFLTVVLLTIKLSYLKKITQMHYTIGAFFYICFYLFLFEGTQIRVGYAVTLVMMAFYCLQKEKCFSAFFLIVLASQIHLTALAFLIVLPFYFARPLNIAVYLLFITAPLLILFDISLLSLAEGFITALNPKYIFYFDQKTRIVQNSTGLYVYFIAFFATILVVMFYYLKSCILNNRFIRAIFSTSLCGVIAMCLFHDYVAVGARLGELLLVPVVILLSYLYMHFYTNKMHIHQIVLIFLSSMYFSARVLYLYPTMFNH